jgi:hypothetical protein
MLEQGSSPLHQRRQYEYREVYEVEFSKFEEEFTKRAKPYDCLLQLVKKEDPKKAARMLANRRVRTI